MTQRLTIKKNPLKYMILLIIALLFSQMGLVSWAETQSTKIPLYVKQTFELKTYLISQDLMVESKATWKSYNKLVATVSTSGQITAVAPGETVISATIATGVGYKEFKVTVIVSPGVAAVTLSENSKQLVMGETFDLNAKIVHFNGQTTAFDSGLNWDTNHRQVATVDSKGKVTATGPGKTQIIVETSDGKKKDTCEIEVTSFVTGVVLEQGDFSLEVGQEKQLTTRISPESAPLKTVTYRATQPKVISVSDKGLVKALSAGQSMVIATTADGHVTTNLTVNVLQGPLVNEKKPEETKPKPPTTTTEKIEVLDIDFIEPPTTAYLGQNVSVAYTVFPENATVKTAAVKMEPSSSVSGTSTPGKLVFTPTKVGKTIVTVAVGKATKSFVVTVKPSVFNMSLVAPSLDTVTDGSAVYIGQEFKLTAVFNVSDIDKSELNPQTLKWNYHSDTVSLVKDPKDPYSATVKLLKAASTVISAEFFDNTVGARIQLTYEPMVQEMILPEMAQIKLNYNYKPLPLLKVKENLRYGYKAPFNLECDVVLEEAYVETSFLKNEIQFEYENVPKILEKAKGLTEAQKKEVIDEWNLHILRRKNLESLMEKPQEPYQLIKNISLLTDRDARTARFFEMKSDGISSGINGKALIRVTSRDGLITKKMWVVVKNQEEEFLMMDKEGNLLLKSSDQAAQLLEAKKINDQKIQNAAAKLKYKETTEKDLPSEPYWGSVYASIESGLITEKQFKGRYTEPATKLNWIQLLTKAYEMKLKKTLPPVTAYYFADIKNQEVEKAYQLGIITGNAPKKFSPQAKVDAKLLKDTINRWLKATHQTIEDQVVTSLIESAPLHTNEALIALVEKLLKLK